MDDRQAAEVLWRGYFTHSKSWLVEAVESWMKSISNDSLLSKDPLVSAYAKIGVITFAVQAIEDFACMGYAYLRALDEGVERIYEHVRDFADPERENVGTVPGFFNLILSDNEAIQRLFGREFGLSAKPHMRAIYDFCNKYRALYLKFKHGQGFVVMQWENTLAVYIIPKTIDREKGRVKLPKDDFLITLDEWEHARDIAHRINGYFLRVRSLSVELFPAWKKEYEESLGRIIGKDAL